MYQCQQYLNYSDIQIRHNPTNTGLSRDLVSPRETSFSANVVVAVIVVGVVVVVVGAFEHP
jgi:hypothetical protein